MFDVNIYISCEHTDQRDCANHRNSLISETYNSTGTYSLSYSSDIDNRVVTGTEHLCTRIINSEPLLYVKPYFRTFYIHCVKRFI